MNDIKVENILLSLFECLLHFPREKENSRFDILIGGFYSCCLVSDVGQQSR